MTSSAWEELGFAIRKARLDLGWSLEKLATEALSNGARKGYVGQVEKGRRNLSPETIDKFDQALTLPEDVVKAAHMAPPPEPKQAAPRKGKEPTPNKPIDDVDRDAERLLSRAALDDSNAPVAEALLTTLAYEFAEGQYRDLHTAYTALRQALEAAENIRKRGDMPPDNTGSQLNAVMAEVAKLNNQGAMDDADALLDAEEDRMREAQQAERDRMEQQAQAMLTQRIDQDRLRNRPDLAAERITRNLRDFPRGKLFWSVNDEADQRILDGDRAGDVFSLEVALALAKDNYERVKTKKPLAASALYTFGLSHFRLAERSTRDIHLKDAQRALDAAVRKTNKAKEPEKWAIRQGSLGVVLREMGQRQKDADLLGKAVAATRSGLKVEQQTKSADLRFGLIYHGNSQRALGELNNDADALRKAEEAFIEALALENSESDPLNWGLTQINMAIAQRWLGAISSDPAKLQEARDGYAACEDLAFEKDAPFEWARLQWNIADLALARYHLDPDPAYLAEARTHVAHARAFFVEGSDYQTERCDDLLAQIDAAEAAA